MTNAALSPRCHIVGGGDFDPSLLQRYRREGDFLIAADRGGDYLQKAGILPHLTVGDLDSADFDPVGEVLRLPVEKDDTDLVAAAREGLRLGYTEFFVYGALGGRRFSHSLAALQLLAFLKDRGGRGFLLDQGVTVLFLENESLRFRAEEDGDPHPLKAAAKAGNHLSLLLHSDTALVSEKGLYYSLEKALLTNRFPLGVSNSFTETAASVWVEEGSAFLVLEEA